MVFFAMRVLVGLVVRRVVMLLVGVRASFEVLRVMIVRRLAKTFLTVEDQEVHTERVERRNKNTRHHSVAMAVRRPDWQVDALDLSPDALALAAENVALHRLDARVRLLQSDLFGALDDEIYDLIVSNPPYITDAEYAAMPGEYAHEPKLGLTSGADGCDACLRILRHAPKHLAAHGLLIVEVGEAERALKRLLPLMPLVWIEFSVGQMGVFALEARALRGHHAAIEEICEARGL